MIHNNHCFVFGMRPRNLFEYRAFFGVFKVFDAGKFNSEIVIMIPLLLG